MSFTVTVFKSPYNISKQFNYNAEGELEKKSAIPLGKGTAYKILHSSMQDFADTVKKLDETSAMCYGEMEHDVAEVGSKKLLEENPELIDDGWITRTRANFAYPQKPGILFVDYDPDGAAMPMEEIYSSICKSIPGLADCPMMWKVSAGSCIYDSATGEELVGIRGQHFYFLINDLTKSRAIILKLAEDIKGIDKVTPQPERLDYQQAYCGDGLEKRDPPIIVRNNQAVSFDTAEFESDDPNAPKTGKELHGSSDEVPTWKRIEQIHAGENFHDNIVNLTWGWAKEGMQHSTIVGTIQGIMQGCVVKDDRWRDRFGDIGRTVQGALDRHTGGKVEFTESKIDAIISDNKYDHNAIDWPPGMMGELSRAAYMHQKLRNKPLAIITAFACLAGIVGKKYNISGTGLNVYYTVIMDSGSGKDQITKFRDRLYGEIGADGDNGHIGSRRYTGPKALANELLVRPSCLSIFTEAGILFSSSAGDGAGLLRTILGLYTASGKHEKLAPESYSDSKENLPPLESVALSIVNEATPTTLLRELQKRESAATGELPRMFIHRLDGEVPYESEDDTFFLEESLKTKLIALVDACRPGILDSVIEIDRNNEIYMPFSRYCTDQRRVYKGSDELKASMYTRAAVKLMKLCGLMCALDGESKMTQEYFEWAKSMHEYEMRGLESLFQGHTSDDQIGGAESVIVNAVIKILSNAFKDKKKQVSSKMRNEGVFTKYALSQVVRNNRELRDLDNTRGGRMIKGYQIVLDAMVDEGVFKQLDDGACASKYMSKAKGHYKVTEYFKLNYDL